MTTINHKIEINIENKIITISRKDKKILSIYGDEIEWNELKVNEFEAALVDFIHQCHIRPCNKEE